MRYHHSYCCLTYMVRWNKCGSRFASGRHVPRLRPVATLSRRAGPTQRTVFLVQRSVMPSPNACPHIVNRWTMMRPPVGCSTFAALQSVPVRHATPKASEHL
uniref:Uncharacterized protein n=1 Tax=Anopheles atroparvus TaxID=41427 RepID=A0AAG5D1Z6_ANOAO